MRKLVIILSLSLSSVFVFSQDILVKKNGDEVKIRTLEIGPTEIKYKNFEMPDGPTFVILKSEVFMIKFENGTKEVFKTEVSTPIPPSDNNSNSGQPQSAWDNTGYGKSSESNVNLYSKGEQDAAKYYTKYKGAGTGSFFSGFCLGPVCGLIVPAATGGSQPKTENLGYPDPNLFNDANYRAGYTAKAKKIKRNKAWTNYGIGAGISLAFSLILSASTPAK